jgi:hypothetical protein
MVKEGDIAANSDAGHESEGDEIDIEDSESVVGDDEVITGPEGDDCLDEFTQDQAATQTSAPKKPDVDGKLFQISREMLQSCKNWAQSTKHFDLVEVERPITFRFWGLLQRVDINLLLALWAPSNFQEVRNLFEKDSISDVEPRNLQKAKIEGRSGIYLGFVVEEEHADGTVTSALYVGSSVCVRARVRNHQSPITWKEHPNSRLYQKLKKGSQVKFCVLAVFDCPIERGYLNLFKAIFMFLFGALRCPAHESRYVKKITWELYMSMQKALAYDRKCPVIGLNWAWPLLQGFYNRGSKTSSPCASSNCPAITASKQMPMDDLFFADEHFACHRRFLDDPSNPLGSYICGSYFDHKKHRSSLPDKDFTQPARDQRYFQRCIKHQLALGHDIPCAGVGCHKFEAQDPIQEEKFIMNKLRPGEFLCRRCWRCKARVPEGTVCMNPDCGAKLGNKTLSGREVTFHPQ